MSNAREIFLNTEVWRDGNLYVAYVPLLDVSSCGNSMEEAQHNIREATEVFLEEAAEQGTLFQILEEAGFKFDQTWQAPEFMGMEKMRLAF